MYKIMEDQNMNNKPKIDLTGKKFGKLTAIQYVGRGKWLCQCDCGNTVEKRSSKLRNFKNQTCNSHKSRSTPESKLKPYVFESLTYFGNTVISDQTFERYGEDALLEELRQHGFDCTIRITNLSGAKNIIIETRK